MTMSYLVCQIIASKNLLKFKRHEYKMWDWKPIIGYKDLKSC